MINDIGVIAAIHLHYNNVHRDINRLGMAAWREYYPDRKYIFIDMDYRPGRFLK